MPPWLLLHVASEEERKWLPSHFYQEKGSSPVIRVLRGHKMRTVQGLMDEFGSALQFFDGFGENWSALDECLSYLDEWLAADAYILIVTRPEELLAQEDNEDLLQFCRLINTVGEWWSRAITNNDRFNRGPVPFHVVLRCDQDKLEEAKRRFPTVPLL
jgi:hypothetical protein